MKPEVQAAIAQSLGELGVLPASAADVARPKENQELNATVAVKIKLKRIGKMREPHYRIVVMDSRTKRDGRAIEEIGLYQPKNDPSVIKGSLTESGLEGCAAPGPFN